MKVHTSMHNIDKIFKRSRKDDDNDENKKRKVLRPLHTVFSYPDGMPMFTR